ncbi:MAG: TonB-dependent receptor, partial [Sphingobacteriales bacterium]
MREIDSTLFDVDARLTGSFLEMSGGPAEFAVGVDYRREKVVINPDQLLRQRGLLVSGNFFPAQTLTRNVKSIFAEVKLPLLDRVELQGAARYEKYSDFGGTFNPTIAAKIAVIPDAVMLRGSFGTSFRAPFLENLASGQSASQRTLFDPTVNATVPVVVLTGGNPDLDSETARTFTLGTIITPPMLPGLNVTVDYYNIRQKKIVIAPDAQSIVNGTAPGTIVRGVDVGGVAGRNLLVDAALINGGVREVHGIDALIRYNTEIGQDWRLSTDLAATRVLRFAADIGNGLGIVGLNGTFSTIFGSLPKFKLNAGVALGHAG